VQFTEHSGFYPDTLGLGWTSRHWGGRWEYGGSQEGPGKDHFLLKTRRDSLYIQTSLAICDSLCRWWRNIWWRLSL